jgi:hypothetical protein
MSDKTEWCYAKKSERHAHGPFDSREEAIEDAREYYSGDGVFTIELGHPRYANVDECIPTDAADLVERMDEYAADNDFPGDDPIFEIDQKDLKQADAELQELLKAWAKKWVCSNGCWVLDDTEEVEIQGTGGVGGDD